MLMILQVTSAGTMTRIAQTSSERPSPVRSSNGLTTEAKSSIVDLLNNSSSLVTIASPSQFRNSSGMGAESGVLKRKLSDLGDDVISRRKRIFDYKAVRLKRIRKEYVEHVCEQLTIEGCSVSDMYRKRPSIPSLVIYFKNNALDPNEKIDDLISLVDPIGIQQQSDVKMTVIATAPGVTPVSSSPSMTLMPPVPKPSSQGL